WAVLRDDRRPVGVPGQDVVGLLGVGCRPTLDPAAPAPGRVRPAVFPQRVARDPRAVRGLEQDARVGVVVQAIVGDRDVLTMHVAPHTWTQVVIDFIAIPGATHSRGGLQPTGLPARVETRRVVVVDVVALDQATAARHAQLATAADVVVQQSVPIATSDLDDRAVHIGQHVVLNGPARSTTRAERARLGIVGRVAHAPTLDRDVVSLRGDPLRTGRDLDVVVGRIVGQHYTAVRGHGELSRTRIRSDVLQWPAVEEDL